jgi:hypothetical protein
VQISYQFNFADGAALRIDVDVLRNASGGVDPEQGGGPAAPEWTRLDFRQCPNCPLSAAAHSHCPAARDLAPTISAFAKIISYHEARVEVVMPERTVSRECQVQDALSSLVGLIMATSACPVLGRMRGLARTHLPFATLEETLLRTVGAYLARQLLLHKQGLQPDWDLAGLKAHYTDLEVLNRAFKRRINAAAQQDATLNAVSAWGIVSSGVGFSIDDHLADLEPLVFGAPD